MGYESFILKLFFYRTMSSRALKKKHGRNDLDIIQKSLQNKENQDVPAENGEEPSSGEEEISPHSTKSKNVFALALVTLHTFYLTWPVIKMCVLIL